ncbi:MAG: YncE family protein, partial [bacterium]|nr:YncE family protein [bacterium]
MKRIGNILAFAVVGIMFVFKSYVIVIGQVKPVLVALNKAEANMVIVDPGTMAVLGKVAVGDGPHEVVLSADGKTAYVANYGNQQPGNSISIIDIASAKELKRVDLMPMIRPHGLQFIGGKLY